MREALKNSPDEERVLPTGVVNVRIDPDTGMLAGSRQKNVIYEYFREEYVPQQGPDGEEAGSVSQGTDDLVRDIF